MSLIKNNRFFIPPPDDESDFKVVFHQMARVGAGRPVDDKGIPEGPWTAELLTDAISRIDANRSGVELRTVQRWFECNDTGISSENIRWLARVFGCGDPVAISEWQMELSNAQSRLTVKRRERKRAENSDAKGLTIDDATRQTKRVRKGLAEKCEWLLSGEASMNLLVSYWLVFGALGLMNYALGTLSVTYSPEDGLNKQVGFIWAPTLTVLPLVVLPLYILSVNDLISFWKNGARSQCALSEQNTDFSTSADGWMLKVKSFSFSFWAIALFSLFFVFGFQWAGIYLPAYMSGDTGGVQVDRYLVALSRPEVISIQQAMILSAVGYLYTASYIAVFLLGLLFLVIIALDYRETCGHSIQQNLVTTGVTIREAGNRIIWGSFRIAAFGLWIATLIKLQIVYLSSDAKDFVSWLSWDAQAALGLIATQNGWLDNSSVSHFTTFLMMAVTVATFGFCVAKVHETFARLPFDDDKDRSWPDRDLIVRMSAVIIILSANLLLVGRFEGFSLLVALSVIATFYVVRGPSLNQS